jgi:ABC-type multidrug transport system ATPase subunit
MVPALSVRALSKHYHTGLLGCWRRIDAVRDVSFDLAVGELLLIVGPAAAGKTTLLLCLAGLLRPSAGRIAWFGDQSPGGAGARCAAYASDHPATLPTLTVEDALRFHATVHDHPGESVGDRMRDALERVGLAAARRARVDALPPASLRRLAVAEALVLDPRLVLLDETLTGLQGAASFDLAALLKELSDEGVAVIVASRERATLRTVFHRRLTLLRGQLLRTESDASVARGTTPVARARSRVVAPPPRTTLDSHGTPADL